MPGEEAAQSYNLPERILRIFTEIRPGEGTTAILMALNIFFILTSYYILKPAREAFMSLEPMGAELASYAAAIMAVLLVPLVRLYGRLAERFNRRQLITVVTGFFILNLMVFYLLAEMRVPYVGLGFFVWVGIFNNMIIAQFWAYGNDIYDPEEGKRLFPFILLGQSFGAILGPMVARVAVNLSGNPSFMLLVAATFLALCIFLTIRIDARETARPRGQAKSKEAERPLSSEGGFLLVWKHRYLLYIALLIMVLNLVNTTGEYILRDSVYSAAQGRAVFVATFYSNFFFWVNAFTVIVQAFLVSRVLKLVGVRGALFILPAIALLGYGLIASIPILVLISVVKTAENSVDYSLMNTLRAALYLPTTREMKYKAKQAIDTFFVRAGDVLSAGVVALGIHTFGFGPPGFAGMVITFVIFWLLLARGIAREHKKLLPSE